MKLTKNFQLYEFQSKDGVIASKTIINNLFELATNLQVLRDKVGKSIKITSGYRSIQHNKKIGGEKNSYHTKGMAADIKVEGMRPEEVADIIEKMISEGKMMQGGLGVYSSWVHYDIRGSKARWEK